MNCQICKKHKEGNNLIYEDKNWMVFNGPLSSQLLGYVCIEPKRHVESWAEFTDEELSELGPLIKKVELAIKKELPIDRLYTVTISEAVRHLHVHLIPRENNMNIKGIPLIEQATKQEVKTNKVVEQFQLDDFYDSLKSSLS